MENFDPKDVAQKIMDAVKKEYSELKTLNVMVLGKTGVGKSTLINNMFSKKVAETGIGRPIATDIRKIELPGYPLAIYDTPGLELSGKNDVDNLLEQVIDEIQKGIKRGDASQAIHCIWYCVGAPSRRFEQAEIDFLQKLLHGIESFRVPVIVVLTQSYDIEVAKKLKSAIEKENLAIAKVVPVLAENYILTINDEKYTAKAFGLDKLSEVMNYVVPEAVQKTFIALQAANIELKKGRAQAVVAGSAATAAGIGAVPIPFADAALLVPEQVAMLTGITVAFGVPIEKATLLAVISGTIGPAGTTVFGKTIVGGLLKLIPGAGTVAGMVISGAAAAALTAALGEAYIMILIKVCKGEMKISDITTEEGRAEIKRIFTKRLKVKRNEEGQPKQWKMKEQKGFPREIPGSVNALIAPAKADFLAFVPQARELGYPEYGRVHGLGHIYRVLLLSLIYYYNAGDSLSPEDKNILIYFSLLHDVGRTNDWKDDSHGEKSVEKIKEKPIEIKGLNLTEEGRAIASLAIRCHSISDAKGQELIRSEMMEEHSRDRALKLYRICKDMDGLDRVRLGRRGLNTSQLRTDYAKAMVDIARIIYRDHLARRLAESQKNGEKDTE